MRSRVLVVVAALCALLAQGCQAMIASPAEYSAFRQTRVAPTVEGRLQASAKYLEAYPSGNWSKPVRGWLVRTDKIYFRAKRGSAAGLEAYLRAVPTGAHRAEARRLLAGYAARREESESLARAGDATAARLEDAARERQALRAIVDGWLRRFLGPDAWRGRFRDAPPALITAWNAAPAPMCEDAATGRRCQKTITLELTVPVMGRAESRSVTFIVETREDADGALGEVVLRGRGLFARLHEASTARAHEPGTRAGYEASVRSAVEMADAAFTALVAPASECEKPIVAPAVRQLECRGAGVTVAAGVAEEDEDRIAIRWSLR